jgi:hypothetical protein
MSGVYAAKTTVSSEKSRAEIERTLSRYGAEGFAYGWSGSQAQIAFVMNGVRIQLKLDLPDRNDRRFTHHSRGLRTSDASEREYEQAIRQSWRALALVVKAKLEAVAAGIATFEDEFLAYIAIPGGGTVGDMMKPQIAEAYSSGAIPRGLMLELTETTS